MMLGLGKQRRNDPKVWAQHIMANQKGQTRSASSTMRYLNSSVHGIVPVLRAGGETYLWMPATAGGGNVWRHVLTTGTSPGTARKRIALKVGNLTKAESQPKNFGK